VSEIYDLLRLAATRGRPVVALYDGLPRLLCPHVLGRKSGRLHAFCYSFGGGSHSGLPRAPERTGEWRCLAVEKFGENPGDGGNSLAPLTVGAGGVLYGTTVFGRSATCGWVPFSS